MRVVLDTSVLVAAWRSRLGASFALLPKLRRKEFEIAVSVPLVLEYEAVLRRHLGAPMTVEDMEAFIDYFCAIGIRQQIFFLWRPLLRDPKDDMVVEVAMAAGCDGIVTRNLRDFTAASKLGLSVWSPGEFLQLLDRGE